MNKKATGNTEFQQLPLPLYLGEPFLPVRNKIRNFEARAAVDAIKDNGIVLQRLLDTGAIQSSEARLQIRNFLGILGIN